MILCGQNTVFQDFKIKIIAISTSSFFSVQAKVQMLDNLLDIEVAYSLLRGGAESNDKDPIDINYEKLKTKIEVGKPVDHIFYHTLKDCDDKNQIKLYVCLFRLWTRPQRKLRYFWTTSRTHTLLRTTPTHWKYKR